MRYVWFGIFTLGCAAATSFIGCGDSAETTSTTATGASGGTGGTGGTGATGATGGHGGMPECGQNSECGTDTDCRKFQCESGKCNTVDVPSGVAATDMTAVGDCKKTVCDGAGSTMTANDDADFTDDGTACTADTCANGTGAHTPTASGTACTDNNGAKCDGSGKCVECLLGPDCALSGVCQQNKCVPGSCVNNTKDGGETDKDCGGPVCGKCADGLICAVPGDCLSGVCTGGLCAAPVCNDNVKNGAETGKDCGGGAPMSCPKCGTGEGCAVPLDCTSGVCLGNPLQCQAPTCLDGVLNGTETDIDCAGTCVKKCAPGKICVTNADCIGGLCNQVSKTCDPTCTDGVKNNVETDIDCGGGSCAKCATGKACNGPTDCASSICTGGVCAQVNGCDPVTAEDHTGVGTFTINFGGGLGFVYAPKCIKVSVNTMVTFSGAFPSHPLVAGEVKMAMTFPAAAGTTPLPINPGLSSGATATFSMGNAGTFGYYCGFHGSGGMNGTIFVVP